MKFLTGSTTARKISVISILIFFALAGISVAQPNLLQIGSQSLSNNLTSSDTQSSLGLTGSTWNNQITFSDSNPVSVWQSSGSPYVISVREGSLFSQNANLKGTISVSVSSYLNYGVNWLKYWETVDYKSLNPNSPHYLTWENEYTSSVITYTTSDGGRGFSGSFPITYSSFDFNKNSSTAPYFSQYGIYRFSLNWQINDGWNGASNTQTLTPTYAEVYIVPGTGTINTPSNVLVGNPITLSGTMNYGSYYLLITAPGGSQKTIPLGVSSQLDKSWTTSYTPETLGKYHVELVNSVVNLAETQFFSASALFPTPQIQVLTVADSSGYYSVGEKIDYKIIMNYNVNLPVQFNVYIWSGVLGQQPTSGSGEYIVDNAYVTASFNNGTYTYDGSFIIPNNALQTQSISIIAYGYYATSGNLTVSKNPAEVQISVGTPTHKVLSKGTNLMAIVEAIAITLVGLIIAILNPDLIPWRIVTVISAVISAMIIYGAVLL